METTHDVRIGAHSVVKRFVSNDRGEAEREWSALGLLGEYAPDLAPTPIDFREESGRPLVEMSRVPGHALGSEPLTKEQIRAAATALQTLHGAMPAPVLGELKPRISGAGEMVPMLRDQLAQEAEAGSSRVAEALRLGAEWVRSSEATALERPTTPVFARADGNLANLIWDGYCCRIVDFEDSGCGDLAYEIADLVEHVSAWLTGVLDADEFLDELGRDDLDRERIHQARRLMALFWLTRLLPGGPGHERNPPGSTDRQAERVIALLS